MSTAPTTAYRTETRETPEVDAFTVRLKGRVTHEESPILRQEIFRLLAGRKRAQVVLALGDVESMDTAGAAVLVEALLSAREDGKRVLLCSPSPSVIRMFELAGLEDAFAACCPTPEVTWQRLNE